MNLLERELGRKSKRLLVVDNDPLILNLVKSIQSRANYEPVICNSVEIAKTLLIEETFDGMIINDDTEQGFDLIRRIREIPYVKTLPIIMVSNRRLEKDVKLALDSGVSDYLLKPVDPSLFFDKLELWLRKYRAKREIFEHAIDRGQAAAQITLKCEAKSISETSMTVRLALPMPQNTLCELQASVYQDIGIKPPLTRLISCEKIENRPDDPSLSSDVEYEARLIFVGLPDANLQKIRAWLIREEIKRRK